MTVLRDLGFEVCLLFLIKDCLADPQFYLPGAVDMLLGAEIFFNILAAECGSCPSMLRFIKPVLAG